MVITGQNMLLALDFIALLVALGITAISFNAYRRTRSQTYQFAFVGFVFLTIGVVSEAILFRVGTIPLVMVHTIETGLFILGFSALYISLK
jgi:hypothetical protein